MLDTNSRLPLHVQIEQLLRDQIRSLKPGDRLPTEQDMRAQYRVSTSTIRQAIRALVSDGLVYRKVAKGTFVAAQPIREELSELLGFSRMARSLGLEPSGRLIEAGCIPASPEVASRLQVSPGTTIVHVVRVRYADGEPVCIETTYYPEHIGSLLMGEDLAGGTLYAILEKYGVSLSAARDSIGSTVAKRWEAELLEIPRRSPVLTVERVTYSPKNEPQETAYIVYRADRYRYGVWRRQDSRNSMVWLDEQNPDAQHAWHGREQKSGAQEATDDEIHGSRTLSGGVGERGAGQEYQEPGAGR